MVFDSVCNSEAVVLIGSIRKESGPHGLGTRAAEAEPFPPLQTAGEIGMI